MSGRVTGYHYETDRNGKKHRVYDSPAAKSAYKSARGPKPRGQRNNRSAPVPRTFRGNGGYYDSSFVKTMNRYVPKGSFSELGSTIAGPLGKAGGAAFAKLLGFGSYNVKQNSILSEGQSPAVMHSGSNKFRIRHREYIQDIVSSSVVNAFQLNSYAINPGLQQVFPWLSAIATQFEEYRILGMVFEFKTLYADAIASSAANSSIGGVIMATDYNANNPNFINKQQMDNTQYTVSDKPSNSFYHPVECNPRETPLPMLYIRNGALDANIDQKTYDLGVFQVASFGIASTSVTLGELWCSYEIELSKPISTASLGQDILSDHIKLTGTVNNTHPMGTTSVVTSGSSLGGTTSAVGYQWPAWVQEGNYLVVWALTGTATGSLVLPTITTATNCTSLQVFYGDGNAGIQIPSGAGLTSASCCAVYVITITAPYASFAFGTATTIPAAIGSGDLFVTQINSAITL